MQASMKVTIILAEGLQGWQAINVASHLSLAVGRYAGPEIMGEHPLTDKSGVPHTGICKYPIVALRAAPAAVRSILEAARTTDSLFIVDYPREMLETGPDEELVAALAARKEAYLEYLGIAILGPASSLKKLTGHLALWR